MKQLYEYEGQLWSNYMNMRGNYEATILRRAATMNQPYEYERQLGSNFVYELLLKYYTNNFYPVLCILIKQ